MRKTHENYSKKALKNSNKDDFIAVLVALQAITLGLVLKTECLRISS